MNEELLEYIDRIIESGMKRRVFTVEFKGNSYYVKQDISNHRSSWIKPAPRAAFDYEFYKISFVCTQMPLAPEIVGLREHYFVTADKGRTLSYFCDLSKRHPEDTSLVDMLQHIFFIFGKALGELHDKGIGHGRPAMRDIVFDPDTDQITLLDWENNRRWPELTYRGWDVLLFVHSFFREDNLPLAYLYAMINGYTQAATSYETIRHIKEILHKHDYLFRFCHMLDRFHFVDTEAATKAYDFLSELRE